MVLLSSLLPGLRDLRVPLSVGFTWVAFGWLLVAPVLPNPEDATGALKHIYGLFAYFGPVAVFGVATFLAYVVGVVTTHKFTSFFGFVTLTSRLMLAPYRLPVMRRLIDPELNKMNEMRDLGFPFLSSYSAIDRPLFAALTRLEDEGVPIRRVLSCLPLTRTKFVQPLSPDELATMEGPSTLDEEFWSWIFTDDGKRYARHDVAKDLPVLANRLLLREKALFDKFDRDATESEFRLGIMLPLAAITFVLVAQAGWFISPWNMVAAVIAGYTVLIAFLLRGRLKQIDANAVLLEALDEGLITAPTIEALQQLSTAESHRPWFKRRKNRAVPSDS